MLGVGVGKNIIYHNLDQLIFIMIIIIIIITIQRDICIYIVGVHISRHRTTVETRYVWTWFWNVIRSPVDAHTIPAKVKKWLHEDRWHAAAAALEKETKQKRKMKEALKKLILEAGCLLLVWHLRYRCNL